MSKLFGVGSLVLIGFIAGAYFDQALHDPIECTPKPLITLDNTAEEEKQNVTATTCAPCVCDNMLSEAETEKDASESKVKETASSQKKLSPFQNMVVDSRMRVISRFFDLTDKQKKQIKSNFTSQVGEKRFDKESAYRALSEVLGSEDATFFRKKQKEAFERVKQEAAHKETVYLSRILDLTPDQEDQVEGVYLDLEERVKQTMANLIEQGELDDNELSNLSTQSKVRRDILSKSFASILNEPQYRSYIDYESQSSEAETELWH